MFTFCASQLYIHAVIKCLCWHIILLFIMWDSVITCPLAGAVVMLVIHAYNHLAAIISLMVNNKMTLGWWSGGIYKLIATLKGLSRDHTRYLCWGLWGGGQLCNIVFVVKRKGRGLFNGHGNAHYTTYSCCLLKKKQEYHEKWKWLPRFYV